MVGWNRLWKEEAQVSLESSLELASGEGERQCLAEETGAGVRQAVPLGWVLEVDSGLGCMLSHVHSAYLLKKMWALSSGDDCAPG